MKNSQLLGCLVAILLAVSCQRDREPRKRATSNPETPAPTFASFSPVWASSVEQSAAWSQRDLIWDNYRKKFHWHYQMIAMQSFPKDGSHLLVLSEPPADFSLREITDFFSFYNSRLEVKQHPVGQDGWVKDVVVALSDVPLEEVQKMIWRLNCLLFKTDYKADTYLQLPVADGQAVFLKDNLNYKVTFAELQKWFLEDREQLVSPSDERMILADLLHLGKTGVYFSENAGFTVWIMPRNRNLNDFRADIRRFSLDSDMILGSISNEGFLAVIGRERVNSITELPPLRTETVCQLAAADKKELAQSYERTMFLAGKLPGGEDWAPIFLSDELINTEYGSLLNITDQMLKSWSSNGKIEYKNWHYPRPNRYAFRGSIMEELESGSVTFNWNTKGGAYMAPSGDFEIVALNRTGALPISYIPGGGDSEDPEERVITGPVRQAEEKGYDYFSSLNNPDLMRVVQYGALYQIFRNFDIHGSALGNNGQKPNEPLSKSYVSAINRISKLDDGQISSAAKKMEEEMEQKLLHSMTSEERENYKLYREIGLLEADNATAEKEANLMQMRSIALASVQSAGVNELAKALAWMREPEKLNRAQVSDQSIGLGQKFQSCAYGLALYDYGRFLGIDIQNVFNSYLDSWYSSQSDWIKTPSVVRSWSVVDSAFATGGHNLGSRIVPIRVDRSLAAGQFRVVEEGGMRRAYVGGNSLENMSPRMLRAIEDAKPGASVRKFSLGEMPKTSLPPRPRVNVVKTEPRMARGLNDGHIYARKTATGFEVNGKTCSTRSEFNRILEAERGRMTGKKLEYRLEGLTRDEVHATIRTQEVKAAFARNQMLKGEGFYKRLTSQHYDFESASVRAMHAEGKVVVEIPAFGLGRKAIFEITRLSKNLVEKVTAIVNKVLGRCKTNPKLNFRDELVNDLKAEGINPDHLFFRDVEDIIISLLLRARDVFEIEPAINQPETKNAEPVS